MKKTTKGLLMAAFTFLIVGAAFGISSLCFGFRVEAFREAMEEGKFHLVGPTNWSDDLKTWLSNLTTENVEFAESYTGIEKLDLDIGAADCAIIPYAGEEWKVNGYNLPASFTCRQSGKTLKIDCSKSFWSFFHFGGNDAVLELYIPKDQCVDEITIDAGVGYVETVDGTLICDKLEFDCGVGDCTLSLDVRKKAKIDGGVGNIWMELAGSEKDYNYDVECGIGSISIGDRYYSELGSEKKINNNADVDLKLDCGVGDIEIYFKEDLS